MLLLLLLLFIKSYEIIGKIIIKMDSMFLF